VILPSAAATAAGVTCQCQPDCNLSDFVLVRVTRGVVSGKIEGPGCRGDVIPSSHDSVPRTDRDTAAAAAAAAAEAEAAEAIESMVVLRNK
jgi:hypothetical protein